MIDINVNYDPEEDSTNTNAQMEIRGRKTAVNEVASIFTILFRAIPLDAFLEGMMTSEFGQDVLSKTDSKS